MDVVNPIVRRWQQDAAADPDAFWARAAAQLPWFRPWDETFAWDPPTFRWFSGGLTNLSYNALDHHVAAGRGGHAALIAHNERGERQVYTYAQLLAEVKAVAAALRGLGVGRGDRVAVYLPTIPEAIMAMLAITRIGAIHLVVFAGFGSGALAERMRLAGARVLLTADVTWRKGREIDLWAIAAEALQDPQSPLEHVVILPRRGEPPLSKGRPRSDLGRVPGSGPGSIERARGHGGERAGLRPGHLRHHRQAEAGRPHPRRLPGRHPQHGRLVLRLETGRRLVVDVRRRLDRRPQLHRLRAAAGRLHDHRLRGRARSPQPGDVLPPHRREPGDGDLHGADGRAHADGLRHGAGGAVRSLVGGARRLRRGGAQHPGLGVAADARSSPTACRSSTTCGRRRPAVPSSATPTASACCRSNPARPASRCPASSPRCARSEGEPCPPGEKGIVVLTRPFPGLTPTIWGDPERYGQEYWQRIPGVYFTGDAAAVDDDGYYWFSGRADEIIKIAGHRIGTIEVETAFLRHPAVAEAGVCGRPDELRGEVVSAFVVLRGGHAPSDELRRELIATVRHELGPVAVIGEVNFVRMLPKTRSGKIMRRVFKAVCLDRDPGDISTIEDAGSVEEARAAWQELRADVAREA